MKRKIKQLWSIIPTITTITTITTKRTITSETSLTEHKNTWHMTLEIQVHAWDRHTNVVGVKPVNEFPTSTLDNWISNGNTYIYIYIYKQTINKTKYDRQTCVIL